MLKRSVLILVLLMALPALAPPTAAHQEEGHAHDAPAPSAPTDDTMAPSAGYTGPGPQPYVNFYEGVWFYGTVTSTALTDQVPVGLRGDGDWLVWQDSKRGDIFAFNIPAGAGHYLTNDRALQRNPDISGNVVVWEDYRNSTHADVYAYFLDTGETRRISEGPGNHRNPDVDGTVIAWEDDRDRSNDIYAYDLLNGTEFPVFTGADRESDPLVVGNVVYFRTYRFNVWDVVGVDVATGESFQLTSDVSINGAPFTNGRDVLFHTQFFSAWKLDRYDAEQGEPVATGFSFQDTSPLSASGDKLLATAREGLKRQLLVMNLTSGVRTHASGGLSLTSDPHLDGNKVYMTLATERGLALVVFEVSPFAFGRRPEMQILSPRGSAAWIDPIVAEGVFLTDGDWALPATFTYRIDGGAPTAIPYVSRFRFTLDPAGMTPGPHEIVIRATYREGPPIETRMLLLVPGTGTGLDVEEAAVAFHAARVGATINEWFLLNPASYIVIALALFLLVVLGVRVWVMVKPRRERVRVEYVSPDDA